MNLIFVVILFIFLLISVSFLTLLEQKGLSYIQLRKGPNKVSIFGILQPFSDAIKLFSKEYTTPKMSNYFLYYISPVLALVISLMCWMSFPYLLNFLSFNLSFLYLLMCLSMSVYCIMLAGWSSNSIYALLGSIRSIAQTISYEVCLILMFLTYFIMLMSLSFYDFLKFQSYVYMFFINVPISFTMLIIFMAETNRSPFDFAEGESELVSGFNVEYSSGSFALIFLAEYMSILFMSSMYCFMFLSNDFFSIFFFLKIMMVSFTFIWIRASFPRYRYDLLMYLTWKKYLPISLNYLLAIISLKLFFYCLL